MAEYKQMGIRLTEQQRADLETISTATGVEVAQVVRFAIDALVKHYERSGRRLVLPIDFSEVFHLLDAQEPGLRAAEDVPGTVKRKRSTQG